MKKNCYNCKNAYPNLTYKGGPCRFFEDMDEREDWEYLNVCETGCKFWESNQPVENDAQRPRVSP